MPYQKPMTQFSPEGEAKTQVLYIEDNLSNMHLIEAYFQNWPELELITAANGEFGLELIRHNTPDIILLDLNLPTISGREILRHLKSRAATRDIPVIALSADAMPEQVEEGLNEGFSAYLTKPIASDELHATLRQFVKSHEPVVEA